MPKSKSCINFILKNKPKRFQNTGVMGTGTSDHHHLIFLFSAKMPLNKLRYRNYKQFEAHSFLKDVEQLLEKMGKKWEKDFENVKQTRSSKNESDLRKP